MIESENLLNKMSGQGQKFEVRFLKYGQITRKNRSLGCVMTRQRLLSGKISYFRRIKAI